LQISSFTTGKYNISNHFVYFSDLNGFGFCDREIEKLRQILDVKLNEIEADAYRLASRKFRLHSSDDVCQILYRELKLPLNGDEDKGTTMSTFGRKNLRAGLRSGVTPSSSKDILSKLSKFHELPATIIKWRKINAAISNTVVPLARASRKHKLLTMKRIYPTSNTFTSTGRMTMQEPSIQMVPRNFPVDISHDLVECLNQNLNELKAENGNCSRQTTLMHSFTSLLGEDEGKLYFKIKCK
jgi:DNA polymerase theta